MLSDLVRSPSLLGAEDPAQRYMVSVFEHMGLESGSSRSTTTRSGSTRLIPVR